MSSPQFKLRYLLNFQRQRENINDVGNYGKLDFHDIKRLDTYIKGNIFVGDKCCLYTGEIKKKYSTISYNGKKVSVLRLLYHNYIDDINHEDNLEYLCDNPGICCNLRHFKIKGKTSNINFEDIYDDYDKDPFSELPNINIKKPILNHDEILDDDDDDDYNENNDNKDVFHFD